MLSNELNISSTLFSEISNSEAEVVSGGWSAGRDYIRIYDSTINGTGGNATNNGTQSNNGNGSNVVAGGPGVVIGGGA